MDFSSPLVIGIAVSFVLSLVPGGKYAVYPLKLFNTWAHECSHAVMAILMGGQVSRITLSPDTSGLTVFKIAPGRFRQAAVASAGYLGANAFGCALYFAGVTQARNAPLILMVIGGLMLVSLLLWVRNLFGATIVLALGGAMLAAGRYGGKTPHFELLLPFLGLQTGLNAFLDLPVLFGLNPKVASDARTMKKLFWLPAGLWALLWMALSLVMMTWTIARAGGWKSG